MNGSNARTSIIREGSAQLSLSQIKKAFHQAEKIVARYGDRYFPIFERFEKEYHDRKDKVETLKRAIKIAEKHGDSNLRSPKNWDTKWHT